jgi:aminoglycoside phosphotransferase (APT) family kinase protein
VLDWEMATVGDPRADLGYLLSFWPEPGGDATRWRPRHVRRRLPDAAPSWSQAWEQGTGRAAGDPPGS